MIVDDEKALVALVEETLAELGYEPVGFSSSAQALQAFREAPQRFDAVLTDERCRSSSHRARPGDPTAAARNRHCADERL